MILNHHLGKPCSVNVEIDGVPHSIPLDFANRHFREVWLENLKLQIIDIPLEHCKNPHMKP